MSIQRGIIGAGRWGQNYLRVLEGLPEVQLKWCADSSPERLQALRDSYPQVNLTLDYKEILADAGLQALIVASPPSPITPSLPNA